MSWLVTSVQMGITVGLYLFAVVIFTLSSFPGALLCYSVAVGTAGLSPSQRVLAVCLAAGIGYFLFGLTLMVLSGATRILFGLTLREGEYSMASPGAIKWFVVNALQTLFSITFIDFILLTPFASLFFRLMGARLGRNVQINSKFCADLSLLEIGDRAVIGGHATVIGHSFERGQLILRKVKIGKDAVIGLNAVVLPGAEIGDRAMVAAGAIVPKNTQVAAGSVYRGISD